MGQNTPKVKCWSNTRAELYIGTEAPLSVGSEAWFKWLELPETKSFSFDSGSHLVSDFTARRETRKKGNYWYGYKRIYGKLHNTYIGMTSDLTLAWLLEVGKQFLNRKPSTDYTSETICVTAPPPDELVTLKAEIQRLQGKLHKSQQFWSEVVQKQDGIIRYLTQERDRLEQEVNRLRPKTNDLEVKKANGTRG